LSAVVVKWARARKRYERQGLLVENEALERAEKECAADENARKKARERAAIRRAELDQEYIGRFGARVREIFCPMLDVRRSSFYLQSPSHSSLPVFSHSKFDVGRSMFDVHLFIPSHLVPQSQMSPVTGYTL